MESWLKQPLQERVSAYQQWLQERGQGSKKKGFIRKSTLAMALKDGSDLENAASAVSASVRSTAQATTTIPTTMTSSSPKTVTIFVNESGEYVHMTTSNQQKANESAKENKSPNLAESKLKENGNDESANDDEEEDQVEDVDYYSSYAFMAFDLEDEIKWFNVSRELFSRAILGRSKSRFSEIMGEAKHQPFACGSTAVVKNILLLCDWMSKPLEERCASYLKWRADGGKTSGSSTADSSSSKQKIIPLTIQTDTGEIFQVEGVVEGDDENSGEGGAKSSKFQAEVLQSKIDFRSVTIRLERELRAYDVGLTMFMKNLLPDITLAAFSQMLKDSKSKNFVCKRRSTLEKFKLIVEWLNQSEHERIQTYRMWKVGRDQHLFSLLLLTGGGNVKIVFTTILPLF